MFKSIIGYFRKNWKTYFLEFSLIAIALFTLLYRIVMALKYGKAFLSDASIIPLMANRILQNHEFPALYWGQKYMGVPEAYVMALLGSLRGQVTEFMASFVTLLFYALFAFITSYLLYRITKNSPLLVFVFYYLPLEDSL